VEGTYSGPICPSGVSLTLRNDWKKSVSVAAIVMVNLDKIRCGMELEGANVEAHG